MQPPCTRRYFSFQAAYSTRILLRRFVAHSYGRRATFVDQSSMRTNISKPVHASPPSSFVSYISSSRSSKTISPEFTTFRSIFSLSTWRMVVVLFLPSLTLCREIFDSHHSRYQHDSTGVFPSSRSPLLFLLCSLACTDRRIKSTWKLECTALPLLLPWLLTRNILVVNCGGGR